MSDCGIYLIRNTTNGKVYVGSSVRIKSRWNHHRSGLNRGLHGNLHLQASWDKYGADSFEWSVLELCPRGSIVEREQHWIDTHDAHASGYNQRPIANSPKGTSWDDERKLRHRQAMSRPEVRQTMSLGRRGLVLSEEHRARIGEGLTGRICSDETRAKLSDSAKKRGLSEQFIKASGNRKGQKMSAEARAKISEALRNRPPISEETRHKLREAARRRVEAKQPSVTTL